MAAEHGTTEHHLRRMFSSLAGMPVSEYVRRRRMSLAAADVAKSSDDLLMIAVRYGYGSTEAFGRAFRAVHGVGLTDARRNGGPFRSQQQLRFRLTVEGNAPMHVRITDRPAFRLAGRPALDARSPKRPTTRRPRGDRSPNGAPPAPLPSRESPRQ